MSYSIAETPLDERPRERFLTVGPEGMATSELIAILLGSGMRGKSVLELSRELLHHFGGLDQLGEATVEELSAVKGMGPAKAIQLRAAFTLAQRFTLKPAEHRPFVRTPLHAYQLVRDQLSLCKQEHFLVILLDTKMRHIQTETVAIGTLDEALVHPREVFYPAIRHKAASMILAHNHPSGDPEPSDEDRILTKRLVQTGDILGISVEDHLVVGREGYVSLRERGWFTK